MSKIIKIFYLVFPKVLNWVQKDTGIYEIEIFFKGNKLESRGPYFHTCDLVSEENTKYDSIIFDVSEYCYELTLSEEEILKLFTWNVIKKADWNCHHSVNKKIDEKLVIFDKPYIHISILK